MGEAKRRKETEDNYGKVPKYPPRRGLVVSRPMEIEGTSVQFRGGAIDSQELRFATLLWDELVLPESNFIGYASPPDEAFLESAGILRKVKFAFSGDVATGVAAGQMQVFRELDRTAPGAWALAQGERSFLWHDGQTQENGGSLLELHRAIPIPKHDVPLAEVLEFKERRRDELLLLRQHLDTFASDIERATDKEQALSAKVAEIDRACANLLEVGREWQFPVHVSNLKTSFSLDLSRIIVPGVAAFGAQKTFSLGVTAAITAAIPVALASVLSVKGDWGLRSLKRPASPYRYAYHMHEELN